MNIYTLDIQSPDIRNMQDVEMLMNALSTSPGIDLVEVDVDKRSVHVTTANQDGGADVIRRMDDAGFAVWQVSVL